MKFNTFFLLTFFSWVLFNSSSAQINQYNFFVGEDAELMQTTIKGFGSFNGTGYMDAQIAFNLNDEKESGFFATAGLGLYYKKFRFQNDLVLEKVGDVLVATPDDPSLYTSGFFSYSKSKLVVFTATLQPELGFHINKSFAIGIAPRVDFSLSAKHKRKFTENDTRMKFKETGLDNYDVNPIQLGINLRLGGYKRGIETAYMFSPFFASSGSPMVQTVSIGFYNRIFVNEDDDEDDEDDDN